MKRLTILSLIAISLLLNYSCENWLDVQPESEIVLEDFWQNESQVNQMLASCYKSLTEGDAISRMLVWGELRSDNVTYGTNVPEQMYKILNVDISPTNEYCQWGAFYRTINYCNIFLHYAPGVVSIDPNFNETELHQLEAEALTLRALSYFYLIRSFKRIPWIDQPSIDDSQDYSIPDTTEEYILSNILADLDIAKLNARSNFEKPVYNKGRITKNAVWSLLADIYLWQGDYNNCTYACDQVLEDDIQGLELVPGKSVIDEVFYDGNSTESIFELQYDDQTWFNWVIRDYLGGNGNLFGYWSFPNVLVTGFASPFRYPVGSGYESKNDLREIDFLRQMGADKYYVFKYAGAIRTEDTDGSYTYILRNTTANWIIYRLSDIMLMKAEALIQLENNNSEAIELINTVYLRSNPDLLGVGLDLENYNTKLDLENLLLRERQRELMFEGKRWYDLMRLTRREGKSAPLISYIAKKYSGTAGARLTKLADMNALYFPIHIDELKANTKLEQNEFYKLTGEE